MLLLSTQIVTKLEIISKKGPKKCIVALFQSDPIQVKAHLYYHKAKQSKVTLDCPFIIINQTIWEKNYTHGNIIGPSSLLFITSTQFNKLLQTIQYTLLQRKTNSIL